MVQGNTILYVTALEKDQPKHPTTVHQLDFKETETPMEHHQGMLFAAFHPDLVLKDYKLRYDDNTH